MKKVYILLSFCMLVTANAFGNDFYKEFIEKHDIDDETKALKSDNPADFWKSMINNNQTFLQFVDNIQKNKGAEKEALSIVSQIPKFDIKYREEVLEYLQNTSDELFAQLGKIDGIETCIVSDKSINAFTTYSNNGMIVAMNLGLWAAKGMTNEILVGIAAHEYAHANLFHILRQSYEEAKRKRRNKLLAGIAIGVTGIGNVVSSIITAQSGIKTDNGETFDNTLYNTIKSYHEDLNKFHFKFSKELELEADLIAYRFLEWSGLGGENYIEAIKLIGSHNPEGYIDDDESDHPSHRERIEFLNYVRSHPEIGNTENAKILNKKAKILKEQAKKEKFNSYFDDPIYN